MLDAGQLSAAQDMLDRQDRTLKNTPRMLPAFILPLSPAPFVQLVDSCAEQDQEGEDFEPAQDHQEAREDFDPAGQQQEVLAAVKQRHDRARA